MIVVRLRADVNHHPWLIAIAIPAETHRLEILESGEAVQLVT